MIKFILTGIIIIFFSCLLWFTIQYFQLLNKPGDPVSFVIEDNNLDNTIDTLYDRGIIDNKFTFRFYYNSTANTTTTIYPRTYVLLSSSKYNTIFREITTPVSPISRTIVIPEHSNINDILLRLPDYNYLEAVRNKELIKKIKDNYNIKESFFSLEGFLSPDTYNLKSNWTSLDLVNEQINKFENNVDKLTYQQLLKASVIDKLDVYYKDKIKLNQILNTRIKNKQSINLQENNQLLNFSNNKLTKPLSNPNFNIIKLAENKTESDYKYFSYNRKDCNRLSFFKTKKEYLVYIKKYQSEIINSLNQCKFL